jgi:hypothetical protein
MSKLLKLLKGSYSTVKFRAVLHDLTRLALLTERAWTSCAPCKTDVNKLADGYWFTSSRARRRPLRGRIPLHPSRVKIIERR